MTIKLSFKPATEGLGLQIKADVEAAKLGKRKPLLAMGLLEPHAGSAPDEIKEFPRVRLAEAPTLPFTKTGEGE